MVPVNYNNYKDELSEYKLIPSVGLLDANGVETLFSYTEIDYEYEQAHAHRVKELLGEGIPTDEATNIATQELCEFSSSRVLYGGWIKNENGVYEPHLSDDEEFSAIYNKEEHTIQVVASRYVTRCAKATNYPRHGDIESYGRVLTYCLPWVVMGDQWLEEKNYRVCSIKKLLKVVRVARGRSEGINPFEYKLVRLLMNADMENIRKLYKSYPGLVRAVCIYMDSLNKLVDELK